MMARLYALAIRLRRNGWFVPSAAGTLFPFPLLWQGWALFGGLVATLAIASQLAGSVARPVALVAIGVYLVLSYWTMDPD
jgi:hypothetical protein